MVQFLISAVHSIHKALNLETLSTITKSEWSHLEKPLRPSVTCFLPVFYQDRWFSLRLLNICLIVYALLTYYCLRLYYLIWLFLLFVWLQNVFKSVEILILFLIFLVQESLVFISNSFVFFDISACKQGQKRKTYQQSYIASFQNIYSCQYYFRLEYFNSHFIGWLKMSWVVFLSTVS